MIPQDRASCEVRLPWRRTHAMPMPMPSRSTNHAVYPLLLAATFLAGCSSEDPPPRPNIVVYLVDTLRQDHLGLYGYERETSPSVDALAEDSIVFKQAYATSAWTKASTGSLLTGLHPRQHGATSRSSPLSSQAKLLSEYLSPIGYFCAGLVTNPFVVEHWGFNRGYDVFEDLGENLPSVGGWMQIQAEQVNQRAFEVLDGRPDDQPFFLYLHSIDPHGPNIPIEPYDTLFTDNPRPPGVASMLAMRPQARRVKNTIALYDSEIRYSDDQFGNFIQGLKDRGLYEDTVIWFVSDHGEEFLDHGRGGHGTQLFNEVVEVPLILKLPGQDHGGQLVDTPVSLVDVMVTQLYLLERHAPETLAGRDLLQLLGAAPEPAPVFLDLNLVAGGKKVLHVSKGVVLGDYKYFEELAPEPRQFLFNVREDPDEMDNLIDSLPEKATELDLLLRMQRSTEKSGLIIQGISSKATEHTQWNLTLRTDGQFVEVTPIDLEAMDSYDFEPGGTRLKIECLLMPQQDNVVKKGLLQDKDAFEIRVDPPDARVYVESNEYGGVEERMPVFLGPLRTETTAPLEFLANQGDLKMDDLSTLFTEAERNPGSSVEGVFIPPGVYVIHLPNARSGDIEIPAAMVERLKALGYL